MRGKHVLPSRIHIVFLAAFLLGLVFPLAATGQGNNDIVGNVEKRTGVKLPSLYDTKVRDFMENNPIMKDSDTREFTINFIVDQMKLDWGINKYSQLLFIWDAIYSQVTGIDLYDGEDGDEQLLDDYEISVNMAEACGKKYNNELVLYLRLITEELNRRTEESQRRTEESQRRTEAMIANIMSQDTVGLRNLTEIYDLYKKDNNSVTSGEIERLKAMASHIIADCKKYGIDYRAILLKETGDEKKVHAILKFYEIAD